MKYIYIYIYIYIFTHIYIHIYIYENNNLQLAIIMQNDISIYHVIQENEKMKNDPF